MNPLAAITATFEVSPRETLASGIPDLDALTDLAVLQLDLAARPRIVDS